MDGLPENAQDQVKKTGWLGNSTFPLHSRRDSPNTTYTPQQIRGGFPYAETRDLKFYTQLCIGSNDSNRSDSIIHCDSDFRGLPWYDYCVFTPDPATQVQTLGRIHAIFDVLPTAGAAARRNYLSVRCYELQRVDARFIPHAILPWHHMVCVHGEAAWAVVDVKEQLTDTAFVLPVVKAGDTLDHAADPDHAWWVDRLLYTPVHVRCFVFVICFCWFM